MCTMNLAIACVMEDIILITYETNEVILFL